MLCQLFCQKEIKEKHKRSESNNTYYVQYMFNILAESTYIGLYNS